MAMMRNMVTRKVMVMVMVIFTLGRAATRGAGGGGAAFWVGAGFCNKVNSLNHT